ncbi:hypothetical protein V8D89_005200 [Ganoderma adspersum]
MATATDPAPTTPISDFSKVPDWLLTHPELLKRGIALHKPLQPLSVYQTKWITYGPVYVVKTLKPSKPEADIFELLDQHADSPSDHTIPHELLRSERPIVIMPFAGCIEEVFTFKTSSILAAFDQVLEGVEHMHRLRIAHGDIFTPNVVAAIEEDVQRDARLKAGRVYLIDFETCRQFEHGPGVQTAVPLMDTHVVAPLEMTSFDPFSWDVYCLGETLEVMVEQKFVLNRDETPWIPGVFARWLKGDEAGCTTSVCRCRPTVTRARQVLAIVRWVARVAEVFAYPITLFKAPPRPRYTL